MTSSFANCWICGNPCPPDECKADELGRSMHEKCYVLFLKQLSTESAPRHQCVIYEGAPSRTLSALAEIVRQKLEDHYRCLYLNSPPMVAGMGCYLAAKGVDVAQAISNGSLVFSSEQTHLVDGRFQTERMMNTLEGALRSALNDGYKGIWASGDMSWEFGPQKDFAKILEYEWQLEQLLSRNPAICGICQYHRDTLPAEVVRCGLLSHRSVFLNETLSHINPYYVSESNNLQSTNTRPRVGPLELDHAIANLCRAQQPN